MKPKRKPVVTFYGKDLFDLVVPEDHPFRVLKKVITWKRVRKILMTDSNGKLIEYSPSGRPAWDPVIIFKMLFFQRYHPASDRMVEEQAQMNLAYRYFLGIPIPESVPDATTLCRYRKFWGDEKVKKIFIELFGQIRSYGVARVQPGIVGDTTHQHASIQKPTARQLLLAVFEMWETILFQLADEFPSLFTNPIFQSTRMAFPKWLKEYKKACWEKELSRKERFVRLVEYILTVMKKVEDTLPGILPPVVVNSKKGIHYIRQTELLKQLLEENVTRKDGEICQKQKGRKVISAVDKDARAGQKSKTNRFIGYKVVVGMTQDRFYSSVETLPGNESDMNQAVPIVTETVETSSEVPEAASFDQGFNSVSNRLDLHSVGIQPGIDQRPRTNPRNSQLFTADTFVLDGKTMTVTCPAGQTTGRFTENQKTECYIFQFAKDVCAACSSKTSCTTSKNGRTVQFSQHFRLLEGDCKFLETDEYEVLHKARWGLEACFGTDKNSHGLGKTPYHGLKKTSFHNRMVGIVHNLKRLVKLVELGVIQLPKSQRVSGDSV